MKINPFKYWLLCCALFLTYGCENFDYFESEEDLGKRIQAEWTCIHIPKDSIDEVWTFSNGRMTIRYGNNLPIVDSTDYVVKTEVDDARLNLENFGTFGTNSCYKGSWDIIRLEDNIMILALKGTGGACGTGILQREFVKRAQ
ncbi:MAG: hypothetical protein RIQ89_1213 [Bacteroidota bacterium]|jgi:hypothetical protein